MAVTDHYDFRYIDPDEEISEFPDFWNYTIDGIDEAIHDAATNDVDLDRLPNLPASQTTSGEFAISRIPSLSASKINSGRFTEARMPSDILDRLDKLEKLSRETGRRSIGELMEKGSGTIYVQRRGNIVELNLYGVEPDGEPSNSLVNLFGTSGFPHGFRPTASWSGPCGYVGESEVTGIPRLFMNNAGRMDVNNPGVKLYSQYVYFTNDDWPSSLPGDPA